MRRFLHRFILLFFGVTFILYTAKSESKFNKKVSVKSEINNETSISATYWTDSVLNSLSLTERIAQLLMVKVFPEQDSVRFCELIEQIQLYNIGSVIFFKTGPVQLANTCNKLQLLAKTPLFVGLDGEWGLAMRLDSTMKYPKQMMLGAVDDNSLIYQMGTDIAWQCKRIGIHTNFAPVVDINSNPKNPVINTRSFGENKENVLEKATAYMLGLQDNHVIATAKHFPGHGDTETDSHLDLPIIPYSFQRIDSVELYPYKELIASGIKGIMVAHLNVPGIDSTPNLPSTLSPLIVNELLKKQMNFKGLVITDALNMKGVAKYGKPGEVALKAFLAGNDILLMPEDVAASINAIQQAVDLNIISVDEINRRCRKVLQAKKWLGLDHYKPAKIENIYTDLNQPLFELNRRELLESAITVVKNEDDLLPLKQLDKLKIASVVIGDNDSSVFQSTLDLYTNIDKYSIDKNATTQKFDSLKRILAKYNLVIAGLLNTDMRASKAFGITPASVEFLKQLADTANVILDLFASPYALEWFMPTGTFQAIIVSYEDSPWIQDISAQVIFGGAKALGTLPVKASDEYLVGTGIQLNNTIRFKYTIPEELGINRSKLNVLDSIINDGIAQKAYPGCQVLLAKDGKVFYFKTIGYHTYDSTTTVKKTDIYDIASITKIAATTPAIMWLYDKGDFSLSQRLSHYLPELKKSDKGKLKIKDLLTHQSGLQPYIPFYINTLQCQNTGEKVLTKLPSKENSYKISEGAYLNLNTTYKKDLFSKIKKKGYTTQVVDSLFISNAYADTILNGIKKSDLYKKTTYRYSDLGFMLLQKAVVEVIDKPYDVWLDSVLYNPLGASSMCYRPLNRFPKSQIVPTEDDKAFRKQLIQGYVHDQTTAMVGGISGQAGLFANANDLAKLMQLYLQNGEYGGQNFFKPKTVELFTSRPKNDIGNRRGLGFDKPEPDTTKQSPVARCVSDLSYGHTGFTGVMTWVDPRYQLVYVFLSNRVYPVANGNKLAEMNIRTKIQEEIYKILNETGE
jgi:beta-N-acetylhexosaminidase